MSREVRRVPKNWRHPIDWERYDCKEGPSWIPLMGRDMIQYAEEDEEIVEEEYMPDWSPDEATHYMMYETITEGTPMSPAMSSPEELARWLHNHDANYACYKTASYETWLEVCLEGKEPAMFSAPGRGVWTENV